ncbi:hypothetical protein [Amycolatopsis sp. WGS_07]|uniref:hypothetical protein n=1 Tax=Amycolatopsis sp. WGS_07 TaxID=3076764 RepID=UPI0038739750
MPPSAGGAAGVVGGAAASSCGASAFFGSPTTVVLPSLPTTMRAGSPPGTMPSCFAAGASDAGDCAFATSRSSRSFVSISEALSVRSFSSRYESAIACVVNHSVAATPTASSPIITSTNDARDRGQRSFSRVRVVFASTVSGSGAGLFGARWRNRSARCARRAYARSAAVVRRRAGASVSVAAFRGARSAAVDDERRDFVGAVIAALRSVVLRAAAPRRPAGCARSRSRRLSPLPW